MDASVRSQNGVSESPVESNKCLTKHLLIVAVIWKDFAKLDIRKFGHLQIGKCEDSNPK